LRPRPAACRAASRARAAAWPPAVVVITAAAARGAALAFLAGAVPKQLRVAVDKAHGQQRLDALVHGDVLFGVKKGRVFVRGGGAE